MDPAKVRNQNKKGEASDDMELALQEIRQAKKLLASVVVAFKVRFWLILVGCVFCLFLRVFQKIVNLNICVIWGGPEVESVIQVQWN